MTIPIGVLNAILANLGTILIKRFVPYIKFKSHHKESHFIMFSIFLISYLSMGLNLMIVDDSLDTTIPPDF